MAGKSISSKDEEQERRALMMEKIDMGAVLEAKEVYDAVMQSFPTTLGKSVSKKERDELGLKDASLVYGEITFETFAIVMEKIKKVYGLPFANSCGPAGMLQSRGGIFYDLGSGTGKPVIAAAICHNFDVCYGIEVLEGLYSMSLDAMNMYNTKGKARLAGRSTDTYIQMIQGDFLKLRTKDWRDADIVFTNSTCYDEKLMEQLAKLATGMKKGSFFISLTRRLPSSEFQLLEYDMYRMSWGEATVFILQKTTERGEDASDAEEEEEEEEEEGEEELFHQQKDANIDMFHNDDDYDVSLDN